MTAGLNAILDKVILCPSGDALRYPIRSQDFSAAAADRLFSWRAVVRERWLLGALDERRPDLVIVGPDTALSSADLRKLTARTWVVDLSGKLSGSRVNARRRTLDESWFLTARAAAESSLEIIATSLSPPLGAMTRDHAGALILRLKNDIALRLRRLEILIEMLGSSDLDGLNVVVLEGDIPLADIGAAVVERGAQVVIKSLPVSRAAAHRHKSRYRSAVEPDSDTSALADEIRNWPRKSGKLHLQGVVFASDLRNAKDFRHAQSIWSLLDATVRRGETAVLLQPYSRITGNTLRVVRMARRRGVRVALIRQPQAAGLFPALAPLRAHLLLALKERLSSSLPESTRAAILEAVGGFIVSSLAPALATAESLAVAMKMGRPKLVAATPLGSPFGALAVSAARRTGTPSLEVQTLLIGTSERDPAPIADHVAVLDTEQRATFQRRFGVSDERFILAGRLGAAFPAEQQVSIPSSGVLFASQPLDDVCVKALEILAGACAIAGVPLAVAPHPDETDEDIVGYQNVLAQHAGLAGAVLDRGAATREMSAYRVVATVVSNVALWAAARGQDVVIIDVAVDLPLDFAGMGIALKAASVEELVLILDDLDRNGPRKKDLAKSRGAYFDRNPQLRDPNSVERILDHVLQGVARG
ncbi:MAG: hypothetical protein ACK4NU_00820 [Brevundimonas sp.]